MSCHQPDLPMSWRRRAFKAADTKNTVRPVTRYRTRKASARTAPFRAVRETPAMKNRKIA